MDINNHQVSSKPQAVRRNWGRATEHPWPERESEPWSAAQASAVCRSLARGALPPGDDLSWQAAASRGVALCAVVAAAIDSSEGGCDSATGSIHLNTDGPSPSAL